MQTWIRQNPEYEYWFWTDEDIRTFIKRKFRILLSTFDNLPGAVHRADAFR